jgi:HlyD family secretion protein
MRAPDSPRHENEYEGRRWLGARSDEGDGPQGTALILELRRLQVALNREIHDEPRTSRLHSDRVEYGRVRPPDARRPAAKRKRRKGAVSRAVDICLENLWFSNRSPVDRARGFAELTDVRPAAQSTKTMRRDSDEKAPPASGDHLGESSASQAASRIGNSQRPRNDIAQETQVEHWSDFPGRGRQQHAPATTFKTRREWVGRAIEPCMGPLRFIYGFLVNRASGTLIEHKLGTELAVRVGHAFEGELRTGLRVLILSVGIMGGWAILVPLSGAVVVPGALVVESKVKKVQHPTGGVVAQILVHDGAHIGTGDLLMRLDETQARANYQMLTKQHDQIRVRTARLVAERDGTDELGTPHELATRVGEVDVGQLLTSERSLFQARTIARQSQKELLRSHVSQLGEQIVGFDAQIKSKATQLDLISGELEGVQSLYQKGLVPLTRLTTLQREAARLDGERGQFVSSIAEAKSKISEAEIQLLRVDQDFRTELMKDLRESQDKEAELTERTVAARDLLHRVDIRSPTTGIVHQLSVHTIGGVIAPGEVIMEIVPDSDDLEIEARLLPQDIDQVRPGQMTYVRLSAFNQRTTPQLNGLVSYVSVDLSHDRQTNAPYYTVRVTLPANERRRLAGLQLVSGMPAEVFLQTGSRTMMSYLFKPITDQLQRTFNER